MKTKKLARKKEGFFFKGYKACIKATKPKVTFYYLGKKIEKGTLILSNHESTKGPLSWDFFSGIPVRFLGSEEMNSGLIRMYKYQSKVYYHEKKHWNLFLARLFCLLASPLTNLFYKGLDLISIREGFGLGRTIKDAYTSLVEYEENLVLFPEDSTKGYLEELEAFHQGFLLICEYALKRGHDIPISVAYYRKKDNKCFVDEAIPYSVFKEKYETREKIAEVLKDRCNELGKMDASTLERK